MKLSALIYFYLCSYLCLLIPLFYDIINLGIADIFRTYLYRNCFATFNLINKVIDLFSQDTRKYIFG